MANQLSESLQNVAQQLLAVRLMLADLPERYRIGCVAVECALVDIQPHADDAVADPLALQPVLYQYASNLSVAPVDVVRPFDAQVTDMSAQCLADGQRCHHRDMKLPVGVPSLCLAGRDVHGEQQVLAPFALPGVGAAASSCRLIVSPNHLTRDLPPCLRGAVRRTEGRESPSEVVAHPQVCAVRLFNMYYSPLHTILLCIVRLPLCTSKVFFSVFDVYSFSVCSRR